MGRGIFQLEWEVSREGYEVVEAQPVQGGQRAPYLVARPGRRYPTKPFDEPSLYLDFASLPIDYESIIDFAATHGWLGVGEPVVTVDGAFTTGESLWLWVSEVAAMRSVVGYCERAKQGKLRGRVRWHGDVMSYAWPIGTARRSVEKDSETLGRLRTVSEQLQPRITLTADDLRDIEPRDSASAVLRGIVQREVNRRLTKYRVTPRLIWDVKAQRLATYVYPANLVGAMWLQLALAMDAETTFRRCAQCGGWFADEPRRGGEKRYCSRACRQAAYRQRRGSQDAGL